MRRYPTALHAVLKALPRARFEALARRHGADRRVRRLTCWAQLVALVVAQLMGARSLRELVVGLDCHRSRLAALGVATVHRSTLSDANRRRPLAPFLDAFALLLDRADPGPARAAGRAVRLVDATTVRLGALARWARFAAGHAAAKLHVVYDPAAAVPTYFAITPARVNDIVAAKAMPLTPGATYVFDKGYYDFGFWAALDAAGCRFVTRRKVNSPVAEVAARVPEGAGIVRDRVVRLSRRLAASRRNPYTGALREVVVEAAPGATLTLLSNDLRAPAAEIAALYRVRWQVELFFRWIKQNLKVTTFLGTAEHAVRLQLVVALIVHLLLRLAHRAWAAAAVSLHDLTRRLRATLLHPVTPADLLRPPRARDRPAVGPPRPGPRLATQARA